MNKFRKTIAQQPICASSSLSLLLGPRSGWMPSLFGFDNAKTKGHIWLAPVGLAKRRISRTLCDSLARYI